MAIQIPILKVDGILIASIYVSLDDQSMTRFQEQLLEKVAAEDAPGVVIDLSAVDVVDSFVARSINDVAVATRLLGSQLAIVGLQPEVAITLVEMGLSIDNAITELDLEAGLAVLRRRTTTASRSFRPGRGSQES